jgi:prepilin-type N-terminal cleavage/methylation domain-containing protein
MHLSLGRAKGLTKKTGGFTIVELLVVIVIIAILVSISLVAYGGISQRAVVASLQSDLSNASTALKSFQAEKGSYPTTISVDCSASPDSNTNKCLKVSGDNVMVGYSANKNTNASSYILIASNGNNVYKVTESTSPAQLVVTTQPGVTPGAVLELNAVKANGGTGPGINSPLTTTWYDTSGLGNSTVFSGLSGSPWSSSPSRLTLDGIDDSGLIPDVSAGESESFSYEIWGWVDPSLSGNGYALSESSSLSTSPLIAMGVGSSRLPRFIYINDAAAQITVQATAGVMDNGQPHHVVGTMNAGTLNLYYDGSQATGVTPVSASPRPVTLDRAYVGAYKRGASAISARWYGVLCVVRIYPFALSTSQITANYNAGPGW